MLSAVAARKARLAGKPVPLPTAPPPQPPAPIVPNPVAEPPEPATSKPPSSKRKPSQPAGKAIKKKRKKQPKSAGDPQRYFEQDAFKEQHDVIELDDESDDSDSISLHDVPSPASDAHARVNSDVVVAKRPRRRAWSPSEPLRDSSDEDEDGPHNQDLMANTLNMAPIPGTSKVAPGTLSTFHPVVDQNTFFLTPDDTRALQLSDSEDDAAGTLLVLQPSDTLALLGMYKLTVLQGAVSLMGSVLAASRASHRVFAPRSSPIPVLENAGPCAESELLPIPDRFRPAVGHDAAVILLQDLQSDVERLGLVCRTFEGVFSPSRSHSKMPSVDLHLRGVHLLQAETSEIASFVVPPSWRDAITSVVQGLQSSNHPRCVCLVKGPRNSGKSTFARTLLNYLITRYRRVAFLECDLGQSEFTPAGMVALTVLNKPVLGPAFTHPSLPHAAHFVGATSPKSCPSYYIECIQALLQSYNLDIQYDTLSDDDAKGADKRITDAVPLVVNTMGWTRGLGSDLSIKIEELVEPSHVLELEAPQVDDAYSGYPPSSSNHGHASGASERIYRIDAVAPPAAASFFSPADHRTLSILSYFHSTFSQSASSTLHDPATTSPGLTVSRITQTWDVSLPLCAQLPYETDCKTAFDHIVLVGAGMEDVVPPELPRVLNGAIVGLVQCEPGAMDDLPDDLDSSPDLPYSQGGPPPSPFLSNCCGLALVRSISYSEEALRMHLLTPVPPALLSGVRVLIKGELELPVWGMLDFRSAQGNIAGVERDKVPFLRWGKSEGAGAERRRVRRNIMRRGQM